MSTDQKPYSARAMAWLLIDAYEHMTPEDQRSVGPPPRWSDVPKDWSGDRPPTDRPPRGGNRT